MGLSWGVPPGDAPIATKCVPPTELDNLPGSDGAGNIDLFGSFGMKLPPFRRVQYVLRKTRGKIETPYAVDMGRDGILHVGDDGWKLEKG